MAPAPGSQPSLREREQRKTLEMRTSSLTIQVPGYCQLCGALGGTEEPQGSELVQDHSGQCSFPWEAWPCCVLLAILALSTTPRRVFCLGTRSHFTMGLAFLIAKSGESACSGFPISLTLDSTFNVFLPLCAQSLP